jgi:hypothetical protein
MPHLTLVANETRLVSVIVGGYAELTNSVAVQIGAVHLEKPSPAG